ncbi:MAG: hypothetical protein LBG74_03550, partial [Spirochaetaceae bacterium]|nr:hypothetical protein [Spirochaetaceae bacterium]
MVIIEKIKNKLYFYLKTQKNKKYEYSSEGKILKEKNVNITHNIIRKYNIANKKYELKGIHYGAYWMGDNDVVKAMADDLSEICNLTIIDLALYSRCKSDKVKQSIPTPNGMVNYLNLDKIKD